MKLSSLVAYRNNLESMVPVDSAPFVHEKLAPILHEVKTGVFQTPEIAEQLERDYKNILDQIVNFEDTVDRVRAEIDQTIVHLEAGYYRASDLLYNDMMDHDSIQHILNRRFVIDTATKNFITARIQLHGKWQHAGMIIRPGHEDWIDLLVGCDPLYLVDTDEDLLQPAVLRFNDQYQRRLRTYVVNERTDQPVLQTLPDAQFAYCLAYNFFNFKPESVILDYLTDIYQKLKPGGSAAFTFNDGDRSGAVDLAERHYSFYTPGKKIYHHINQLGFTIQQKYTVDAACVWVEVQKPGLLTSFRGGQALAEIVPKH
jgi:SAM-dependent methyltransferase